jgi:hypothetical protein
MHPDQEDPVRNGMKSPKRQPAGATRNGASRRTLLSRALPFFSAPVEKVGDEGFDLLAGGFAEGFGPAEVDGVGLYQVVDVSGPDIFDPI